MEKGSILVVLEGIVDFLVPYDTTVSSGYVDQLDPEGVPD